MTASIALPLRLAPAAKVTVERVERRESTDGELIERVAGGDRPAFEELYRRYVRAGLGLSLRRIGVRGSS